MCTSSALNSLHLRAAGTKRGFMEPATDEILLAQIRDGDRAALEQVLERYQRKVWRFGLKLCGNEADASDVVQETLLAAARGLRQFRGEASLSTWLFMLARSFCIKMRRRPALSEGLHEVLDRADPGPSPEELSSSQQLHRALEAAISSLGPPAREVFVLRDVEGLSAVETAKVLELSVEAVKSRLHRARAAVRAQIARALQLPEASAAPGCPDIVDLYSRHLEGDIGKELCEQMEAHLATCERCTQQCDRLREVLATCRASPLPEVPPQVQAALRAAIAQLSGLE